MGRTGRAGTTVEVSKAFYEQYCEYCPYALVEHICYKENYDMCICRKEWKVVIENGKRYFKKVEVET